MKTYAILISFVVVGLVLSLIAARCPQGLWVGSWLLQLAAVLVIGGGLGIIDKTLLHRDHFASTRQLFMIHESTVQLGLRYIARDVNQHSYAHIVRESPSLSIVLNDGRTWISAHITDMKTRFEKNDFVTEFFVPDPKGSFISIIAKKTGYTFEEQVAKIEQAKNRLLEEFDIGGQVGVLRIYHIPHFPTHSVFLGSEEAFVSQYGVSSGRRAVPLFVYTRVSDSNCLYADVQDDVAKLRAESKCVYDSIQTKAGANKSVQATSDSRANTSDTCA